MLFFFFFFLIQENWGPGGIAQEALALLNLPPARLSNSFQRKGTLG